MRRRGYTLLEIMVAVGLAGLLMAFGSVLLSQLLRQSWRGLQNLGLEQEGLMALQRLRGHVQKSSLAGVSARLDPPVLAVNELLPGTQDEVMDNAGNLHWEAGLKVFFARGERLLLRSLPDGGAPVLDLSDVTRPKRLDPAVLLQIQQGGGAAQILCYHVQSFALEGSDGVALLQPLKLSLTLRDGSVTKKVTTTLFLGSST